MTIQKQSVLKKKFGSAEIQSGFNTDVSLVELRILNQNAKYAAKIHDDCARYRA